MDMLLMDTIVRFFYPFPSMYLLVARFIIGFVDSPTHAMLPQGMCAVLFWGILRY